MGCEQHDGKEAGNAGSSAVHALLITDQFLPPLGPVISNPVTAWDVNYPVGSARAESQLLVAVMISGKAVFSREYSAGF